MIEIHSCSYFCERPPCIKAQRDELRDNLAYEQGEAYPTPNFTVVKPKEKKMFVDQVKGEGLKSLLGEQVTFFCMNYIYSGMLVKVNKTCALLQNPKIVYETGAFTDAAWKDAQPVCPQLYIQISSIESFGVVK